MTSPIRDLLVARGAVFATRHGVEVPLHYGDAVAEARAVRETVGLADFSFTQRYRVPEAGLDVFDRYAAGAVASIRFGRVLHTVALDEGGRLESDLYIANDDDQLLLIGEALVDGKATDTTLAALGGPAAGVREIGAETALFGLDGFRAWAVVKELFGPDVLGLPYLSLETYELDNVTVKLLRAGKTAEFGYLLLVPAAAAATVFERLEAAGRPHGLALVGTLAHDALRLDGRFFNIHEEGARVGDPLALGLQWTVDLGKEEFRGRDALLARRAAGPGRKIIGVLTATDDQPLAVGDPIRHGDETVAVVQAAAFSHVLGRRIGLALFERPYAYSGLTFADVAGRPVRTISLPPFLPKSLTIKLDEL